MTDSKYLVFKRDEMEKWMADNPTPGLPTPVPDAVVIRRQDAFAPPALDAYANAIQCVIEVLQQDGIPTHHDSTLRSIADYFHEQATLAWQAERKLPD